MWQRVFRKLTLHKNQNARRAHLNNSSQFDQNNYTVGHTSTQFCFDSSAALMGWVGAVLRIDHAQAAMKGR